MNICDRYTNIFKYFSSDENVPYSHSDIIDDTGAAD